MKQYLVVKVAEGLNQVVNWVAMPGLFTFEAAQQFMRSALEAEPESRFFIQEVGAA